MTRDTTLWKNHLAWTPVIDVRIYTIQICNQWCVRKAMINPSHSLQLPGSSCDISLHSSNPNLLLWLTVMQIILRKALLWINATPTSHGVHPYSGMKINLQNCIWVLNQYFISTRNFTEKKNIRVLLTPAFLYHWTDWRCFLNSTGHLWRFFFFQDHRVFSIS